MRTATIFELKDQLSSLNKGDLVSLCLQLARNKKENKEYISFRLYESGDLRAYVDEVRAEIAEGMEEVHKTNMHAAKKTIRKILRLTNKYIKFAASKAIEAELRMAFCESLQRTGIPMAKSTVMMNLWQNQVKKAKVAISGLHEDLQYDFTRQLELIIK